jgi:7-cyano-7-deazaguanine synthase
MKIVILASGGIDSSLLMHMLKKEGNEILPLHIDYGQLAEAKEWNSCVKMCEHLSLIPVRMDISGFGQTVNSGLTNASLDIYADAFLPTRNLTFLTMGAAYAFSKGANIVAIGLLANPIFPDQNKNFIAKAQESISVALGKNIQILTPFIDLDKRDILNLAAKHQLPSLTYYCHSGADIPCGKCISCRERIAAEEALRT